MTLFSHPQILIDIFKNKYQLEISPEFLSCADIQLTKRFEYMTGMKVGKNLCISLVSKEWFNYVQGVISSLTFNLYVNHNWNDIEIIWHSKSGRVYVISDSDIDSSDIVFDFKKLDIEEYVRQLFPKTKIPFSLNNLSYELEINRLNIDLQLTLILKRQEDSDNIIRSLSRFLEEFNEASEKRGRLEGVIHNWKSFVQESTIISYEIDLGSVGLSFLKKMLKHLSKIQMLSKVIVN